MKRNYYNKGMTLIELMIVVAVIGILAAVAVPSYLDYIEGSKLNSANKQAELLAGFEDNYYYDNDTYVAGTYTPGSAKTLSSLGWTPADNNDEFKYAVVAGACGDIEKCYSITVTLISDPTITITIP